MICLLLFVVDFCFHMLFPTSPLCRTTILSLQWHCTNYLIDFHKVSNGAVAMAKTTLEQLLVRCATPLKDEEKTEELLAAQDKSFHMVTHDLVREVTSPNSTVRKQAMHSLQVLAHVTGKSVTVIMEPHKEVNKD